MNARSAILARLDASDSSSVATEAAALIREPERPSLYPAELSDKFITQLGMPNVAATLDRVATAADLPAAVAAYLASHRAGPSIYLPPDPMLRGLDWSGLRIESEIAIDGGAALAVAVAGVAETGTLVLDTAPEAPMLPNFLALHHLVLVRSDSLVAHLEDVPPPRQYPRARYWITGVSGTTDIEGQYVRGAHGPRFLHVILLG